MTMLLAISPPAATFRSPFVRFTGFRKLHQSDPHATTRVRLLMPSVVAAFMEMWDEGPVFLDSPTSAATAAAVVCVGTHQPVGGQTVVKPIGEKCDVVFFVCWHSSSTNPGPPFAIHSVLLVPPSRRLSYRQSFYKLATMS